MSECGGRDRFCHVIRHIESLDRGGGLLLSSAGDPILHAAHVSDQG